jgi:hypothetical protein
MPDIPSALEVYPVHHVPIMKAYADRLGFVRSINHLVPTAGSFSFRRGIA